MSEQVKSSFWQNRQFGHWDLRQFDQVTYECVVAAIIQIHQITNVYPVKQSATSAAWFIGGLMIEVDWTGGVLKISTGWEMDHQPTARERSMYHDVNRFLGGLRAVPVFAQDETVH